MMTGDATCGYLCHELLCRESDARTYLAARSQDISFGRYQERFLLQLNLNNVF